MDITDVHGHISSHCTSVGLFPLVEVMKIISVTLLRVISNCKERERMKLQSIKMSWQHQCLPLIFQVL